MNTSLNASTQFTDTEVIERILAGEKAMFEILIRRNNPYLYKIGRAYNYDHEDTQDLMQDSFIDAYRNLAKFEGRSSFKTWITRIMLNHCFHKKQKKSFANETAREINEKSIPMFSENNNGTESAVAKRELRSLIERALQQLPEDHRMVFALREMTGLNVAETAEALKISEANVKTRLSRARSMLRSGIEKAYTKEDIFEFNLVYCDAMVERVMGKI